MRGPYKIDVENPEKLGTGGIKLRQWRIHRDMTVAMLAAKADVSTGTVSDIEAAKLGWSWRTLHKLADALRTTPAALLGVNPLADREFWTIWDDASEPQRQRIADYAMGAVGEKKERP